MTSTPSTRRAPDDALLDGAGPDALRTLETEGFDVDGEHIHLDDASALPDARRTPFARVFPVPGASPATAPLSGLERTGNTIPEASVVAMFDDIAPVYDRLNTVMTLGADRRWRRAAVAAAGLSPGDAVLDAACGTGKLSAELADAVGPFGRVLAVDLSPGMIERARATYEDLIQLEFQVGNALAIPASDGEFDAATIAFGLRNLADFEAGFAELRRVVRPGGAVVCLELSMPRPAWWGRTYHGLFRRAGPFVGSMVHRRSAYAYLPESLQGFPHPDQLAATMRRSGLVEVGFKRFGLGAVAIHRGRVPAR